MPAERWKVLLDTNVLIAGLASPTGASAAILDLGEAEEILILMSQHILIEADRVFAAKFPHLLERFRLFIKNLSPLLLDDPKPKAVQEASSVIHPDDAPILAAVKITQVDYLVTLDTKHFKTAKVRDYLITPVVTPAEFLDDFRKFWEKNS
jgi:putative PIN family toxin of toxin-antitoxin system